MAFNTHNDSLELLIPVEEVINRYRLILNDVEVVHSKDKIGIRSFLKKFGSAGVDIGIGYKRAYGTVLSGDSFQLFTLPSDTFLFIFTDVSGHGLGAYTTYIKLRAAAILAVREENLRFERSPETKIDFQRIVSNIVETFTNIMEDSVSRDFACVIFAFVTREQDGSFNFRFFNRGMHYPYLVMQNEEGLIHCHNLNDPMKDWDPIKNPPLGSDFRELLGDRYIVSGPASIRLNHGARLCFFSDGIIEASNDGNPPDEYGYGRLDHALKETYSHFPQSAINTLYDEIYEFIGNPARQSDDMTVIIIDIPTITRNQL